MPQLRFVHRFVFMPVHVARCGNSRPVDRGIPVLQLLGEPPRRFRNHLEGASHGVNRLAITAKLPLAHTADEGFNRVDVVQDVAQPLAGILHKTRTRQQGASALELASTPCAVRLEGIDAIAQDTLPQQRLHRFAIYDVAGPSQEFAEVKLQPRILEDADGPFRVEIHQDVDITVWPRCPRATDPNTAACRTPSRCNSAWCVFKISRVLPRSALIFSSLAGPFIGRPPAGLSAACRCWRCAKDRVSGGPSVVGFTVALCGTRPDLDDRPWACPTGEILQ